MPTDYPGALDDTTSLHTVNAGDTLAVANHDDAHNNVRDAVLAIEEKMGVDNSTDPTSFEFRLAHVALTGGGIPFVLPSGGDDTAAIDAAGATDFVLLAPGTYNYNGTGITNALCHIVGSGKEVTFINLGASSYLYHRAGTIEELTLAGVSVVGGKGAIRQSDTGLDSFRQRHIYSCWFHNYTECAIADLGSDTPYWKIRDSFFEGANYTACMGIAIAGQPDDVEITGCSFIKNRIGVKLTYGYNFTIRGCSFFHIGASAGSPRVDVWIVPRPATGGAGGSIIDGCKFGNENLETTDWRIVVADEGAGADYTTKYPVLGTASTNKLATLTVRDCRLTGIAGSTDSPPLLYTTTQGLQGCTVGPINIAVALPRMVVQSLTPLPLPDPQSSGNVLGPVQLPAVTDLPPIVLTNNFALWNAAEDPAQHTECNPATPTMKSGGGRDTSYARLLTQDRASIGLFGVAGGASIGANVADSAGAMHAVEMTIPGAGALVYDSYIGPSVLDDRPCFIEFEIRIGATDPINRVEVCFGINNNFLLRRTVLVTGMWEFHRFVVVAEGLDNNQVFTTFGYPPLTAGVTGTKFQLGRVHVYQAREPVLFDLALPNARTSTSVGAAGGANALPATPTGYVYAQIDGVLRKIPYYAI